MSDSNREWGENSDEAIARRNQADAIGKPPQTEAEIRAAFEAWLTSYAIEYADFTLSVSGYLDWHIEMCWQAWQAASEATQ